MKKVILIVVLGLLLNGCAYEPYDRSGGTGNILEKNSDYIKIGFTMWTDQFDSEIKDADKEKNQSIAINHCASYDKFAFDVGNHEWQDKPYKYLCRKNPRSINLKYSSGKKMPINWTNFNMNSDLNIKNLVAEVKSYCTQLGLKPGSDKYADCSIQLLASKIESQKQIIQQVSSGMSGTVTINDPVRDSEAAIKRGQGLINGTCTLGDLSNC